MDFVLTAIPLAVLTQPYFSKDIPQYIPYATMGLVFGHEMLHGFDLTGENCVRRDEAKTLKMSHTTLDANVIQLIQLQLIYEITVQNTPFSANL